MEKTVLDVKDFSFRYSDMKRNVIENISFDVKEGEFFCIIGANGSGKSTLCNALVGLIPYYFTGTSSGDVSVQGVNIKETTIAELSADIGLVFQNPFNQLSYTTGSVAEELAYGLGNKGVARELMLKKVDSVAKLMRIDHIIDKNPLELSGGQVQRVAFGSTFIMEPRILVLDECTTQLDPMGSEEIFDIVKELNKSGITVIMVDHDMERVARCADRVMVLDDGKQIAIGTPEKIFGDKSLLKHRIDIPDYVNICRAMQENGAYSGAMQVEEGPTVMAVKEAMGA